MRRVSVQRSHSLGRTTDQDLTAPLPAPVQGKLLVLRVGEPLVLRLDDGELWKTTAVESFEGSRHGAEVVTQRTVYRLRYL